VQHCGNLYGRRRVLEVNSNQRRNELYNKTKINSAETFQLFSKALFDLILQE